MSYNIVRNHNDPRNAITLDGIPVRREREIYLSSHHSWIPVLQTSMHFCFKDPSHKLGGSTILCTCGGVANVFGYEGYKRWSSWVGSEVIACNNFIQYGVHEDGSHE